MGVEAGPPEVWLDADERARPAAWAFDVGYAERVGPHSALDQLAASGGWYELRPGVLPTRGENGWDVTVFLDDDDRIAGVALRHGSP